MSTYFRIAVDVRLDDPARRAFMTCHSTDWLKGPRTGASGHLRFDEDEHGAHLVGHDTFRNLGRYLIEELVACATVGRVHGVLTVACTDDGVDVTVARFDGTSVAVGTSDCLQVTEVPVSPATVAVLAVNPFGPVPWYRAVLRTLPGTKGTLQPVVAYKQDCSCGGWDEELDVPMCDRHEPAPPAYDENPFDSCEDLMPIWVAALTSASVPEVTAGHWWYRPLAHALLGRPDAGCLLHEALEHGPEQIRPLIAAHRSLTHDLASDVRLITDAPHQLAANPSTPTEVVDLLPARVVAVAAPWRLAHDDSTRRLVDALGPTSPSSTADFTAVLEMLTESHGS
jgi:hypothetical protein